MPFHNFHLLQGAAGCNIRRYVVDILYENTCAGTTIDNLAVSTRGPPFTTNDLLFPAVPLWSVFLWLQNH